MASTVATERDWQPPPMHGHELIGIAQVPEGVELRLFHKNGEYTIALENNELMSTRASASEEALATMTCARLGGRLAPQLLIGGYGLGFTLRAALAVLGENASVTLAEIVPEVIQWARGPMSALTAGCLDDPRVMLIDEDVAMLIGAARDAYDAILLDVDNGPDGLTRRVNDHLYSDGGLRAAMTALKPGGILTIWSADTDDAFTQRLCDAGFNVTEERVDELQSGGASHMIWFAQKRWSPN